MFLFFSPEVYHDCVGGGAVILVWRKEFEGVGSIGSSSLDQRESASKRRLR